MNTPLIDTSRIESMISQLKTAASKASGEITQEKSGVGQGEERLDFAQMLKSSIDQVNNKMHAAEDLGQRFAMGDESVSLAETMIAMQKASINFQASIQVRNKLVSAYSEVMNMQV